MFSRNAPLRWFGLAIMATLLLVNAELVAAPPDSKSSSEQGKKVAGILMERKDNWLSVKADGDDAAIKYFIDPSNKPLTEVLKGVFNACRVQLTYRMERETRQLVTIKRQIFKPAGTITGTVVKVYDNFWVEVKPKTGVSDAFAPGANYNDKQFMETLRGLKPGDSVTIRFTTDFERHRIESLRINSATGEPASSSGKPR